jgi:hypothetical protein
VTLSHSNSTGPVEVRVARRFVTTAVTKHGPYSPGLPQPRSVTEARTLLLTDAGKFGTEPRDVGMRRSLGGVRVHHGAARSGQDCGHLVSRVGNF